MSGYADIAQAMWFGGLMADGVANKECFCARNDVDG